MGAARHRKRGNPSVAMPMTKKVPYLRWRERLTSTMMTVQQISDSLNFPSHSVFGKYFKRVTGMSPKEYRGKS